MAKRKTPAQLVRNSQVSGPRGTGWFQKLSHGEQEYIKEVVDELVDNPNAALYIVATSLASELNINRHYETIARTLKKMVQDAQQKA